MSHDAGRFVWFELLSEDEESAKRFYQDVLPWTYGAMDVGGPEPYTLIQAGDAPIGGFGALPPGTRPNWVSYVSVPDVAVAAERIVAAGGQILTDIIELPAAGRMQYVCDNTGATFLVFRSVNGDQEELTGPGRVHWNELWAQDVDSAISFYGDALGYDHEVIDMPTGQYYIFKNGDVTRGGMMRSPVAQAPSFWLQYVHVNDCDVAVEQAKARGGTLEGEIMEAPGIGRFAVIKDPLGALLGYITPGG